MSPATLSLLPDLDRSGTEEKKSLCFEVEIKYTFIFHALSNHSSI